MRFPVSPSGLLTKLHKFIGLLIRFVIPVLAIIYLGYSLINLPQETISGWTTSLSFSFPDKLMIAALFFLSAIQWLFEAFKWKGLANKLENTSLASAFVGVLYGLSVGILTPKRTGEFAGRAFLLQPGNRLPGMVLNLTAALSQLAITIFVGLLVFVSIMLKEPGPAGSNLSRFSDSVWIIYSLVLLGFIALPVGFKPATAWLFRQNLSWLKPFAPLQQVSIQELLRLVVFSAMRYLVFSLQFYMLILLFDTPVSLLEAIMLLAITFLALTALPVPTIAEAGVRGSVALLAIDLIFETSLPVIQVGVTASMIGLWVINIVLPSGLGALLGLINGINQKPSKPHS